MSGSASVTTDESGGFRLQPVEGGAGEAIYYLTAEREGGVVLLAVLGSAIPQSITVNELTTVAGAYAYAQLARDGAIHGPAPGLKIAAGMNDNLVKVATGEPGEVLMTSPNADETNSLRSLRSLGNLLAGAVPAHLGRRRVHPKILIWQPKLATVGERDLQDAGFLVEGNSGWDSVRWHFGR